MRRFNKISLILAFSLTAFTATGFAETNLISEYKIVYQTPATSWKLANHQQDADGYTFQYQPPTANTNFQSITINYGKGIQIPLKDSMHQVVSEMNTTDCQRKESDVIKQDQRTLVFRTSLAECSNGKSLVQIFKVFNMPDGQYSIVYSADSQSNSIPDMLKMQSLIEAATLSPIHQST